jgi:hypothetical protein
MAVNVVEIAEPVPDEENARIAEDLAALRRANSWFINHCEQLPAKYPDVWIAFTADGIIDSDASLDALIERLSPSARLDPGVQLEFVSSKPIRINPSTIHLQ